MFDIEDRFLSECEKFVVSSYKQMAAEKKEVLKWKESFWSILMRYAPEIGVEATSQLNIAGHTPFFISGPAAYSG